MSTEALTPLEGSNPSPSAAALVLAQIKANQRAFEQTRSLRKQYRLLLANEPLFAQLGIVHPPMLMQQPPRGIGQRIVWWWLNRGLDPTESLESNAHGKPLGFEPSLDIQPAPPKGWYPSGGSKA